MKGQIKEYRIEQNNIFSLVYIQCKNDRINLFITEFLGAELLYDSFGWYVGHIGYIE